MLKKALLIIVAIVFVLYLSSCGSTTVEGVVIEKYYEPASTYASVLPMLINGRTIMIPKTYSRGAQYKIKVRCMQEDGSETIIEVPVSPKEYAEIEVGDYYTNNKERQE